MQGRIGVVVGIALATAIGFAGCDEARLPVYFGEDQAPGAPATLATAFDPVLAGSISGKVTWNGTVPQVAPFRAPVSPLSEQPTGQKLLWPNPLAPIIDRTSSGIAGAVVWLRGVDPGRARPWNHPPVHVAVRGCQYHILQGDLDANTGFVRRGDKVTIVREDDRFQAVQARGSAFFTLTLADRDQPHERVLNQPGVVELSSNAGQFWMRAHLFVADHPYLVRTDSAGRFTLEKVPSGTYELACWLPDWHEASHELDAETVQVTKMTFRPAVVKLRDVTIESGVRLATDFSYGPADFGH